MERFAWGAGAGILSGLAANAVFRPTDGDLNSAPTMAAAVAGATFGIGLVTSAREGTTPSALAVSGAAGVAGGGVVWLLAGTCGRTASCGDRDLVLRNLSWEAFLLTVPLVAEWVHGVLR